MKTFDPNFHLIEIRALLSGPAGTYRVRLALDTGATSTSINKDILVLIGYDPDALPQTVTITTGSGVEKAARINLDKIEALGYERQGFSVVAHTLPPSAGIDGLLGLDFFRKRILTINFDSGTITVEYPAVQP